MLDEDFCERATEAVLSVVAILMGFMMVTVAVVTTFKIIVFVSASLFDFHPRTGDRAPGEQIVRDEALR